VFWVPSQGCTAAQLPAEVKNRLSHRGQALQKLLQALTN
jgi:XTP/dITP diphosphohydrolase